VNVTRILAVVAAATFLVGFTGGCGAEKSSDPKAAGGVDPNIKPVGRGPTGGAPAGGAPAKGGGTVTAEPVGKN
jgi:hypothetical protein